MLVHLLVSFMDHGKEEEEEERKKKTEKGGPIAGVNMYSAYRHCSKLFIYILSHLVFIATYKVGSIIIPIVQSENRGRVGGGV